MRLSSFWCLCCAASLTLLKAHASLFRQWLLDESSLLQLLSSLLSACRHTNGDVSRIAPSALEAFLLALVDALVEGETAKGEENEAAQGKRRLVRLALLGPVVREVKAGHLSCPLLIAVDCFSCC